MLQQNNKTIKPACTFNSRYVIGISFISALGGYLFGFDFAVISGALAPTCTATAPIASQPVQ